MADSLFIVPLQIWAYGLLHTLAVRLWLFDRALLLAGLLIQALADWLVTGLFGPALSDLLLLSQGLLPLVFSVAVLLLALGYLVAPFFKVRVVSMSKAIAWLLFALLFYQAGPGLYVEGEALRRALASELYSRVLSQASSTPGASGPLALLNEIAAGPDAAIGALENQFGVFVASDVYVDGLDLAMAYSLAEGEDVVYALEALPPAFSAEYFDPLQGPLFYLAMDAEARNESINTALSGLSRLVLAGIVIGFGLFEQATYLCLSLAAGILFISMGFALLLAFFEHTEPVARTLIDMWIELFILSAVIAALQALLVGAVTLGARTLNPTLTLGAAMMGSLVMSVLLLKSAGAIWDALNRMFKALSNTVGGGLMSPAEAGAGAAGAGAGLALNFATAGAGAAVAAGAGASLAQVAGSALSGMDSLYGASAVGSFVLPEGSSLKATAQGFYEGALSSRMLGPLGGLLLAGEGEAPVQSPAPTAPAVAAPPVPSGSTAAAETLSSGGSMSVRAELDRDSLRAAITSAMEAVLRQMPTGGYADIQSATEALRAALAEGPLRDLPGGVAPGDRHLEDYLDREAPALLAPLVMQPPVLSLRPESALEEA